MARRVRLFSSYLEPRITPANTPPVLVADVNPGGASSSPAEITRAGSTLFFTANGGSVGTGNELWRTDGTSLGTSLVRDINTSANSSPRYLTNVGGTLFFVASDGVAGRELWKSDGTSTGTTLVADIRTGLLGSDPFGLTEVNGKLLFFANDGSTGRELWTSDGTSAGTVRISDINTTSAKNATNASRADPVNVGGVLYFVATNSDLAGLDIGNNFEVYRSDGTSAGTTLLNEIAAGLNGSSATELTEFNGQLAFSADDGLNGQELWISNGTSTGTKLVADIAFANNNSSPQNIFNYNGTLVFSADDLTGRELWRSDGTAAGTTLLRDFQPSGNSNPSGFATIGSTLFFTANTFATGFELWRSNGTSTGTTLVADIVPGTAASQPGEITNVAGIAFFRAINPATGDFELYRSDGTAAGTTLIDIDSSQAYPAGLTSDGDKLYFAAFANGVGDELFTLTEDNVAPFVSIANSQSANGSYYTGQSVNVTLTFSEPVDLSGGNLNLQLDTGAKLIIAPFAGLTASATYFVNVGEQSADLTITNILLDATALLRDAVGNNAVIALPVVNLGTTQDILINLPNTPPHITSIPDFLVNAGATIGPEGFIIGDAESPISALTIAVMSSNPALIPLSAITLSGAGAENFITVATAPGLAGSSTITVLVTDGNGVTTAESFLVRQNLPPTISNIPDQFVLAGNTVGPIPFIVATGLTPPDQLLLSVMTSDGVVIPASAVTFGGSGNNRTVTVVTQPGVLAITTLTVTVLDMAFGTTATDSFDIAQNPPITLSDIPNQSVIAGATVGPLAFTITPGLTSEDFLAFSVTTSNGAVIPASAVILGGSGMNRTVTVNTLAGISAATTITITVNDLTFGSSASDSFVVSQTTPAGISDIPDQFIEAGTAIGPLPFTIDGGLTPPDQLIVDVSTSDGTVIPLSAITLGGSGSQRTIALNTLAGITANTTITVRVTNPNFSISASDSFVVRQFPPVIISDIADQSVIAGTTVGPLAFTVMGGPFGPGAISVTAISSDGTVIPPSAITIGSSGSGPDRTITIATIPGLPAITTITVTALDANSGSTASDQFVLRQNIPATIGNIFDQIIIAGNVVGPLAFTIDAGLTPPSALQLSVTTSNGMVIPASAVAFGGTGANRTITITTLAGIPATTTLAVTVTDPVFGTSASDSFTLTQNPLPTITAISDQRVIAGGSVGPLAFAITGGLTPPDQLIIEATSSDGAIIPPAAITLGGSGANRTITVNTIAGLAANTTITVTVSDDAFGTSVSELFAIAQNTPPTLSDIPNQAVRAGIVVGPLPITLNGGLTPPDQLVLSATTSDGTVIPLSAITFGGSGANRTIRIITQTAVVASTTLTITATDPVFGTSSSDTFTIEQTLPVGGPTSEFAVGNGPGTIGTVKLFNADGTERFSVSPFGDGYWCGIRTAAADFNGDGVADLVATTGLDHVGKVIIFDGVSQKVLFDMIPFGDSFFRGVFVSSGDLTGDGLAELVITADSGGGARVRVFSPSSIGSFGQIADFIALTDSNGAADTSFRGGGRSAVGDLNNDGFGDLIFAAGTGGGPRVAAFSGKTLGMNGGPKLFNDFFVFEPSLRNGSFIAAGDINGDGFADLAATPGFGGGPRITIFSGQQLLNNQQVRIADFFGADLTSRGGLRVAVKNLNGDGNADLIVGGGPGESNGVTAYSGADLTQGKTAPSMDFEAFTGFPIGVFVG